MNMQPRRVDTQDALVDTFGEIASAASRQLMIFLPDCGDGVWSSPALLGVVRSFVTARSHRQVQWLFGATDVLARNHGALVALAQRLPSLVVLREVDPNFSPPAAQSFVANDRGQLLLLDSGEHLGGVFSSASERARPLAARFDEAWQRAQALSELRVLGM